MDVEDYAKKVTKLFEDYIDEIQSALINADYRRAESTTDNVIATLTKLKSKV